LSSFQKHLKFGLLIDLLRGFENTPEENDTADHVGKNVRYRPSGKNIPMLVQRNDNANKESFCFFLQGLIQGGTKCFGIKTASVQLVIKIFPKGFFDNNLAPGFLFRRFAIRGLDRLLLCRLIEFRLWREQQPALSMLFHLCQYRDPPFR
jgi:hypothetical protein